MGVVNLFTSHLTITVLFTKFFTVSPSLSGTSNPVDLPLGRYLLHLVKKVWRREERKEGKLIEITLYYMYTTLNG